MDVKKLSNEQLKALAYDELRKQQMASQNIQILEAELERREKGKPKSRTKPNPETTKKK